MEYSQDKQNQITILKYYQKIYIFIKVLFKIFGR